MVLAPRLAASAGSAGGPAKRAGAKGADRQVPVPLGTRVFAIEEGGEGGEEGEGEDGGEDERTVAAGDRQDDSAYESTHVFHEATLISSHSFIIL